MVFSQHTNIWSDVSENLITEKGERLIVPAAYRTVALNLGVFNNILNIMPMENSPFAENIKTELSIPLPDGSFERFYIFESPVMAPELSAKYPEIRTFIGKGIDNISSSGRFDITPAGFHAMIFTSNGTIFIDPYSRGNNEYYISYYKRDYYLENSQRMEYNCPEESGDNEKKENLNLYNEGQKISAPVQLRTYRLACAATGEYTAFHGGTVASGMAAIVTAVNRVVGVYEKEVAARMILVANNDTLVFTNASTDPYTNSSGSTMLGQNQTTCDARIGSANYDIGHVFSTGGGGVAGLGVVCVNGQKARGVTGLPSPTGDPFYIDYVAHEIGHQFRANHTFNGSTGSCSGANRNASTAYEPGSGSTIMAYAGICTGQDLQNNSDAYFHLVSVNEIMSFITTGSGAGCAVVTPTGNNTPDVTIAIGTKTIPISTPFVLTGSASDPDNDALTYCWEQWDLGSAGAPNSPVGNAPIFRSFNPAATPTRVFPKITDVLNNTQTMGEILPTYTRTLNFRLTARDNKAGGGGVGFASSPAISVTNAAGPFVITFPNVSSDVWVANTSQTVTWNVANTNTSPVSCSRVNILLSTDGGNTFPIILAQNTPNDGSETTMAPSILTSLARVKVEAADNLFFDVSNANFQIAPIASPVQVFPANNSINQTTPIALRWGAVNGAIRYSLQVSTSPVFLGFVVNDTTITDTFRIVSNLQSNTKYHWRLSATGNEGKSGWSAVWNFTTVPPAPATPPLISPVNNSINQMVNLTLQWSFAIGATSYRLEVSTDSSFLTLTIVDSNLTTTSKLIGPLAAETKYFWRVNAKNAGGTSPFSEKWNFTTSIAMPGVPVLVSPANAAQNQPVLPTFRWNRQPTADAYRLQVAADTNFKTVVFNDTSITDTMKQLIQMLQNDTKYFWRVNARNVGGTSLYSEIRSFRTIIPLPAQVILVSPTDSATMATNEVTFVWNQGLPAVSRYWLELSTDSLFATPFRDTTVVDTSRTVTNLLNNQPYWWRIRANNIAGWGSFSASRYFKIVTTGITSGNNVPDNYSLSQNYPNPFNPATTIRFGVPRRSHVNIGIFNSLGQQIVAPINGIIEPGYHEVAISMDEFTSGLYFYRIQAVDQTNSTVMFNETKKMILIK